MKSLQIIFIPLIGAVIGWLTNWLAVRMLFRPYRPVKILGYTIQGVIPKRRAFLAKSIGQIVEKELIPLDELIRIAGSEQVLKKATEETAVLIRARVADKLPSFVPLSLRRIISDVIAEQVRKELPAIADEMLIRFTSDLKDKISFEALIEEKVNNFSLKELEEIVVAVSDRELKHIERLGGVLGFIIGLVQLGIVLLM